MTESRFRSILLLVAIAALFSGCISPIDLENWGWDHYRTGDTEKAVQYFQEAKCETCLCKIYSETGQYEKAVKSCEAALQQVGSEGKVRYVHLLANAYEVTGQIERAIEVIKEWVTVDNPNDSNAFSKLSGLYNKNKQYNEAITAAKRAIELKPNNESAYSNLGHAYYMKKQYDDAITAAKKSIALNPKNINNYFLLSSYYDKKEDYASAIATMQKAQELSPDYADIPLSIGFYYTRLGNFDEAISSLNKAISLLMITGVGIRISIEGNYPVVKKLMEGPAKKAGIEVGDKIIKIDGQSTKKWDIEKVTQAIKGTEGTKVILTIEREGFEEPIEKTIIRETIIFEKSSVATALGLRSLVYRIKGNIEDAEKDAEKAYSLDSNNKAAKEALAAFYLDKGKYDDAIKVLSNTSKDNYFARMLEATVYAKKGDYKKAVEIYSLIPEDYLASKSALRQSYKNALLESLKPYIDTKKYTAKSLEAKGQYREALKDYSEILEILKFADSKESREIRTQITSLIKKAPYLSEIPEEARKYALRGEILLKEGKLEEALGEYKSALKIAPYVAVLYRTIALVYGELKDYTQAINNMNIYLDLMPNAPDSRAVKDQIYKWEFLLEKEKGGK